MVQSPEVPDTLPRPSFTDTPSVEAGGAAPMNIVDRLISLGGNTTGSLAAGAPSNTPSWAGQTRQQRPETSATHNLGR